MTHNIFKSKIERSITNFSTGEKYRMIGGADMSFSENDVKKIAKICSQKEEERIRLSERYKNKFYKDFEGDIVDFVVMDRQTRKDLEKIIGPKIYQ